MPPELLLDLRQSIVSAGLESHAEAMIAQALPAVDLILDGASEGEVGECRFGGVPDLPPLMAWPRTTDGRAFVFLLQLNLAQAPAFENSPLPSRGMMWVFVGLDEPATDVEHRIIVWQGDEELRPALRPPIEESANDNYEDMAPQRLRLELRADLPHYSTRYGGLEDEMSEEEQEAYDQLLRRAKNRIGHLLGHVRGVGSDPREDAFIVREVGSKFLYSYEKQKALDMSRAQFWRNLLHLSSFRADNLDFCVWDAGFLNFLIHQDDLQKFDLGRLYAEVASS